MDLNLKRFKLKVGDQGKLNELFRKRYSSRYYTIPNSTFMEQNYASKGSGFTKRNKRLYHRFKRQ